MQILVHAWLIGTKLATLLQKTFPLHRGAITSAERIGCPGHSPPIHTQTLRPVIDQTAPQLR
eukprot:4482254-Amphidinium_carterae.1